jgi:hypothetical protein
VFLALSPQLIDRPVLMLWQPTTGIIFDELYGIRQGMSRQRLPFAMLSPTSERKKGKSNRE